MAFIDRPNFTIEVLKPDWRLTPSATRARATGSDKVKRCADCGKKKVPFEQQILYGAKNVYCSECKIAHRAKVKIK